MQLLPVRVLTLQSPLAPEVALQRIAAQLAAPVLLRLRRPERDFEGEVDAGSFRMNRIRWSTQRAFPQVQGRVLSAPGGSMLELRMSAPALLKVWFLSFIGIGTFLVGTALVAALRHRATAPLVAVPVVTAIGLAGRLIAFRGFAEEMDFAESCLCEWLQSPPLPRAP